MQVFPILIVCVKSLKKVTILRPVKPSQYFTEHTEHCSTFLGRHLRLGLFSVVD